MFSRRKVSNKVDVVGPGKGRRILSSTEEKAVGRPPPGRLDEETEQGALAVFGIGSEVREVGLESLDRSFGIVNRRVHAAIERNYPAGTKALFQFLHCDSAGVAEHQVEISQPGERKVGDRFTSTEPLQSYRGVKVVEDSQAGAAAEHQFRRSDPVVAVRGDDGRIGILDVTPGDLCNGPPVRVKPKVPVG